jgi:hypothetical protein
MSRVTEAEVAKVVEAILEERSNGRATIKELIAEIPNHLTLSADDLAPSLTRPGEVKSSGNSKYVTSLRTSPLPAMLSTKAVW